MLTGEHWYAMQDPTGQPQGYARLRVDDAADGGRRVRWDLRLAFPGGTYEEDRSALFDAEGRMLEATYTDGATTVAVRLEGDRFVGTLDGPDGRVAIDQPAPGGAVAGMGFVLATTLPLEEGYERRVPDFNEAQGMKPEGTAIFVVKGGETLDLPEGRVPAHRVGHVRDDGREVPRRGDTRGRLRQSDCGRGNLRVLHPASTEAQFRP